MVLIPYTRHQGQTASGMVQGAELYDAVYTEVSVKGRVILMLVRQPDDLLCHVVSKPLSCSVTWT